MKVILEGEERIVNTIIRENWVRVSRGQVSFSPADSIHTPEGVTEEKVKAETPKDSDTIGEGEASDGEGGDTDAKEGEETDTTQVSEEDTKDAPEEDTKEVEEVSDTKGKKCSKK